MINKREHHAVPRLYLSGFTQPGTSFVWAYKRGRPYAPGKKRARDNPYLAGIGVTTTKRDRYTVVDLSGSRHFNLIEDQMREWEELGKPALLRVRDGQRLERDDKERLARYIGCMWKRVDKHEHSAREIYEREVAKWQPLPHLLANLGLFGWASEAERALQFVQSDDGRKYTLLRGAVDPLQDMHAGLMKMRWHILRAPIGSYFITSDAPVVFSEAGGLRNSSLGFPLSSEVALLANWMAGEDMIEVAATSEQVRSFNVAIINAAHEEVFASFNEPWVCDVLSEPVRA